MRYYHSKNDPCKFEPGDLDYAREAFEGLCLRDRKVINGCITKARLRIYKTSGLKITYDETLVALWKIGRLINEQDLQEA